MVNYAICFVRNDSRNCGSYSGRNFYWVERKCFMNAVLFLMGFTSVVSVYEIARTNKKSKSDSRIKQILKFEKILI